MAVLLFGSYLAVAAPAQADPGASVFIAPALVEKSASSTHVGGTFTVGIAVTNFHDLAGYQYKLYWNKTVLNVVSVRDYVPFTPGMFVTAVNSTSNNYNATHGLSFFMVACLAPDPTVDIEAATIRDVTFQIKTMLPPTNGSFVHSTIALENTIFGDSNADPIPHETHNGEFYYRNDIDRLIHDVAVTEVISQQQAVYAGETMNVTISARNLGNALENVSVYAFADANTTIIGDEIVIGNSNQILADYNVVAFAFAWNTSGLQQGNYTLTGKAMPVPGETNLDDNVKTGDTVQIFQALQPCPDINVTCPSAMTLNPSIFDFDWTYHARITYLGNATIKSTGFSGLLRIVGSRNGTVRLCVNELGEDVYTFILSENGEVNVPLWLMFQPEEHWGYYTGNYTLKITVCGTHVRYLKIRGIDIDVCQNSAYTVKSETATFTWNLTGGSLVYLEAETDLPPGWAYSVDPAIGSFFETPHVVRVNITASPDAEEGEMGRVTLRAYKNSTHALIWQFVYFASTDNNPPTIESVELPVMNPDGSLFFNATAKDHSGVARTVLHYSVDGGEWHNASMGWSCGDTFNSTQYTVQENIGMGSNSIQYYVSATDWLGREANSSTQTVYLMNDVAISDVTVDKTLVWCGQNVNVTVSISNLGNFPLSIANVILYANYTKIASLPIYYLKNGTTAAAHFVLNTASFPHRAQYVISAFVATVPYEINTENNELEMIGWLKTNNWGDTNVDGAVNVLDLITIANALGTKPGDPKWNPKTDVKQDNVINVLDLIATANHLGENWS